MKRLNINQQFCLCCSREPGPESSTFTHECIRTQEIQASSYYYNYIKNIFLTCALEVVLIIAMRSELWQSCRVKVVIKTYTCSKLYITGLSTTHVCLIVEMFQSSGVVVPGEVGILSTFALFLTQPRKTSCFRNSDM